MMGRLAWLGFFLVACGSVGGGTPDGADSPDATGADARADAAVGIDADDGLQCPTGMAAVPGGSFEMLNKPGLNKIEPFCMDVTHVTAGAYAACTSCSPAGTTTQCNTGIPFRSDDPANCVDAAQAAFYCQSLGRSMPSEEQWEWAGRGGPAGNLYAWGNDVPTAADSPPRLCWIAGRSDVPFPDRPSGTCPVGFFDQSALQPFGLEDISGNVWTWTASEGTTPENRVVRGGGWDNTLADRMTTGFRNDGIPATTRHQALGFRCVAPPLP
jgi:formylglycine-generating enzyme required for sulfatase activity